MPSAKEQREIYFLSGLLHIEQVEDYLKLLINQSSIQVKKLQKSGVKYAITGICPLSLKSSAAHYIMQLCDYWKVSVDVKFASIEIYHQFVATLLNEIYVTIFDKTLCSPSQHKSESKSSKKENHKMDNLQANIFSNRWNETMQHITGQMELRAVTCVAIASKFFSNCSNVTNDMAINFLALNCHNYTFDTLLKSEIRVLKTLKFNITSLPMVLPLVCAFLDCLLERMKSLSKDQIYGFCVKLLICFYTCCDKIYERYLKNVGSVFGDVELSNQVAVLSKDMVLLSCGIIASASYIISKKDSDHVIKILNEVAQLSEKVIATFSFVILEESLC